MLMRRALGAVVALACVTLLSSCAFLPFGSPGGITDDSKQQSDVQMQHIADAVKNHDAAALKRLFSTTARKKATDLDSGLKYFLSVFPSGKMTWKSEGTGGDIDDGAGGQTVYLRAGYKVFANGKTYALFFADFPVNQVEDKHNVGIYALGVVPYSDGGYTASGARKPFALWAGQFGIKDGRTVGDPGVYVPKK